MDTDRPAQLAILRICVRDQVLRQKGYRSGKNGKNRVLFNRQTHNKTNRDSYN